ncbi:hypothetical protein BDN70DRAFT_882382, partial [Pholiota conissans]
MRPRLPQLEDILDTEFPNVRRLAGRSLVIGILRPPLTQPTSLTCAGPQCFVKRALVSQTPGYQWHHAGATRNDSIPPFPSFLPLSAPLKQVKMPFLRTIFSLLITLFPPPNSPSPRSHTGNLPVPCRFQDLKQLPVVLPCLSKASTVQLVGVLFSTRSAKAI